MISVSKIETKTWLCVIQMQVSNSTESMNKLSDFLDFRPKKVFGAPNLQV